MRFRNANVKRLDILGSPPASQRPELDAAAVRSWRKGMGYLSLFAGITTVVATQGQDVYAGEANKAVPPRVRERAVQLVKKLRSGSCSTPELLRRQSEYRLPAQQSKYNMVEAMAGGDNCPGVPIPAGTYTTGTPFVDTGNTTGANSTVDAIPLLCNGSYDQVAGPDHIYSFTLTARGANPRIQVTTTSPTYDISIYVLNGATGDMCPATPGTFEDPVNNCLVGSDSTFFPEAVETLNAGAMNSLPLNTPLYLFVDSYYAGIGGGGATGFGPYTVNIQDVTIAEGGGPTPPENDAPLDMNGDGSSDFVIIRNVGGGTSGQVRWYTYLSGANGGPISATDWGLASDQFITEDFDGDGRDDFAVFRPGDQGVFYIVRSQTNTIYVDGFGQSGDDPSIVGDYTGDGKAEIAVYRSGFGPGGQSVWYYRSLGSQGFNAVPWGLTGDFPAPGDYDGDGKHDFVIQRADGANGLFWKHMNTGEISSEVFGLANDTIAPGDYDGDGKTDIMVVRNEEGSLVWEFEPSGTPGTTVVRDVWGVTATDLIAQGDYDGDGQTEYAIWRSGNPATFYVMTVGTRAITAVSWGETGDAPVANYNVH